MPSLSKASRRQALRTLALSALGCSTSPFLPALAGTIAVLRGLSTKEGDHARASDLMHTGHLPMGPIRYPTVGASLSKALARGESDLPSFVSVSPYLPYHAGSPGFLGAAHAPLTVAAKSGSDQRPDATDGYATLTVDDAEPRPTYLARQATRLELWRTLATLAAAVGVRPTTENLSEMGRPIKIAEGQPVAAVLA
jgi:hypothetical protein